jgi:hypothetical protein
VSSPKTSVGAPPCLTASLSRMASCAGSLSREWYAPPHAPGPRAKARGCSPGRSRSVPARMPRSLTFAEQVDPVVLTCSGFSFERQVCLLRTAPAPLPRPRGDYIFGRSTSTRGSRATGDAPSRAAPAGSEQAPPNHALPRTDPGTHRDLERIGAAAPHSATPHAGARTSTTSRSGKSATTGRAAFAPAARTSRLPPARPRRRLAARTAGIARRSPPAGAPRGAAPSDHSAEGIRPPTRATRPGDARCAGARHLDVRCQKSYHRDNWLVAAKRS